MEYRLKIADRISPVKIVVGDKKGQFEFVDDEQSAMVQATRVSDNKMRISIEGEPAKNAYVVAAADGLWVWCDGRARFIQDEDQVRTRSSSSSTGEGPSEVTPQTPSNVISVMVEVGQQVNKGDALVVVSAMKMETTLTAPYSGTVRAVNTEPGAKANPGDILIEIEKEETGEENE